MQCISTAGKIALCGSEEPSGVNQWCNHISITISMAWRNILQNWKRNTEESTIEIWCITVRGKVSWLSSLHDPCILLFFSFFPSSWPLTRHYATKRSAPRLLSVYLVPNRQRHVRIPLSISRWAQYAGGLWDHGMADSSSCRYAGHVGRIRRVASGKYFIQNSLFCYASLVGNLFLIIAGLNSVLCCCLSVLQVNAAISIQPCSFFRLASLSWLLLSFFDSKFNSPSFSGHCTNLSFFYTCGRASEIDPKPVLLINWTLRTTDICAARRMGYAAIVFWSQANRQCWELALYYSTLDFNRMFWEAVPNGAIE